MRGESKRAPTSTADLISSGIDSVSRKKRVRVLNPGLIILLSYFTVRPPPHPSTLPLHIRDEAIMEDGSGCFSFLNQIGFILLVFSQLFQRGRAVHANV